MGSAQRAALVTMEDEQLCSIRSGRMLAVAFPSLFNSAMTVTGEHVLSRQLLVLTITPLRTTFPSLVLLIISFRLLEGQRLRTVGPCAIVVSRPLITPGCLCSLRRRWIMGRRFWRVSPPGSFLGSQGNFKKSFSVPVVYGAFRCLLVRTRTDSVCLLSARPRLLPATFRVQLCSYRRVGARRIPRAFR